MSVRVDRSPEPSRLAPPLSLSAAAAGLLRHADPTMPAELRAFCADLTARVEAEGAALVRHPGRDAAAAPALQRLFEHVADLVPQTPEGALVYRVEDRSVDGGAHSYSNSTFGGHFHTDGTNLHATPPALIAMICVSPGQSGGESVFIDGRRVVQRLRGAAPDCLAHLERRGAHFFPCAPSLDPSGRLARPIVSPPGAPLLVQYFRTRIEACHEEADAPLPPLAPAHLDTLDSLLQDPGLQRQVALAPGDMLVLDNHRCFHGRRTFVDGGPHGRRRLLLRLWGTPRSST